jgi:5''-3'' exonuclease (including N-terminal domain of PolI)
MKMKKNPKNLEPMLLVDGSNLAYRAYSKFETFKDYKGRKIGLVYGFLKILESYIFRFHPKYTIVTFDTKESKESNFRKALWGSYKEHRKKNLNIDMESFGKQLVIIRKILKYMNIPVVMDTKGLGHESDDYIGYIALKHSKTRSKVTIISSDKDFCQLIGRYIRVYNPFKNTLISKGNCSAVMGYSPDECVDYLCLLGDKSDDIPGYRGIGEVKARSFLDKFGSIQNFLDDDDLTFLELIKKLLKIYMKEIQS